VPTGIVIRGIAYHLPAEGVTNEQLAAEHPGWDMSIVEARAGVVRRHVARPDETALDLAEAACKKLFAQHHEARGHVDAVLFCTQTPDYVMPPNGCVLHGRLGLPEGVFTLDFNHGCSGFPYGLALAQGLALAGFARSILLVTADTYSKCIHPEDRSARVLFGDGAAATWLAAVEGGGGLLDVACATAGKDHGKFIIPAGGCRTPRSDETARPITDDSQNVRTLEHIHMDGMGILKFVSVRVVKQIRAVMERNGVGADDVALFVFHQASNLALDSLTRLLRLPPKKVYRNLARVGNTVSASIPIALEDARREGRVGLGDKVLLSGFGVGLSWATALVRL